MKASKTASKILRLICISLICFRLIPLFVSCRENGNGETTTGADVATTSAAGDETTGFGSLPVDLDLGKAEVSILYWSDVNNPEFEVEETDRVTGAIRKKDSYVQELLNVKINWFGEPGNKSKLENFKKRVESGLQTNETEIIAAHSMVMGALTASGYMQDLLDTRYLEFSNPWWPQDLIENSTIKGKLYFASGDISNNTLLGMEGMFFNKEMVKSDLYGAVRDGKWTFERMISETSGIYRDLNSNGKDAEDVYGYATYSGMINPLFIGMGIRFIEKGAEGEIALSDTYVSEKTQGLLEKVNNCLFTGHDWFYASSFDASAKIFVEGRAAFYMASVRLTINNLADSDVTYGVLPAPMYDEDQESYHTLMANTYTMYGITKNVADTDNASAVIEALAQEGYRTVTPEVFEVALKTRYSNGADDAAMFDILRSSTVFEIGLIFSDQIGGVPSKALFTLVNNKSSDWMSYMKQQKSSIESKIKTLNESDAFGG